MIHGDTKLEWVDFNIPSSKHGTVKELFQTYSHLIEEVNGPNDTKMQYIIMVDKRISVVDQYGWTELVAMIKSPVPGGPHDDSRWIRISTDDTSIIVSDRSLIPVYKLNEAVETGFHGEVKFKYIITEAAMIKPNSVIRQGITTGHEFSRVTDISYPDILDTSGYCIYTKSSRVTVGNVYLHASDSVTCDEAQQWVRNPIVYPSL